MNQAVADGLDGRGCGPVQGRAKGVCVVGQGGSAPCIGLRLGLVALRMPFDHPAGELLNPDLCTSWLSISDRAAKVGSGLSTVTLRTVSNHCATSLHTQTGMEEARMWANGTGNPSA